MGSDLVLRIELAISRNVVDGRRRFRRLVDFNPRRMPLLGHRLGLRRVYADRFGVGVLDDWSLVLPGLNLFVSLVCKDVRFRGNRRGHGSRLAEPAPPKEAP